MWAAPITPDKTVASYSGSISPVPSGAAATFSQSHKPGRPSQSRRYSGLTPLAWYTFTIQAHFDDGTTGTEGSIRAQAPAAPPPPVPPPGTCAAVNAKLRAGDEAEYNGQCHDGDWKYFTVDATSKGSASVILDPKDATHGYHVCGHNNESALADGQWCSSNAEWAKVGGT